MTGPAFDEFVARLARDAVKYGWVRDDVRHGWWWHLWNDPVRDNPASLGLLALCAALMIAYVVSPWRPWSRRWWRERRGRE